MGILNTITKALGLDNTKKTPKEPTRIPKTVQDSIPYLGAYENGIIQVSARGYSRMYALSDINFSIESMDEQRAIFGKYSEFIGSFGPEVQMQVVVHNKSISSSEFEQNVLIGMKNDSLNEYREEMNNMLIDKMAVARNNIIHNKYLVVYRGRRYRGSKEHVFPIGFFYLIGIKETDRYRRGSMFHQGTSFKPLRYLPCGFRYPVLSEIKDEGWTDL